MHFIPRMKCLHLHTLYIAEVNPRNLSNKYGDFSECFLGPLPVGLRNFEIHNIVTAESIHFTTTFFPTTLRKYYIRGCEVFHGFSFYHDTITHPVSGWSYLTHASLDLYGATRVQPVFDLCKNLVQVAIFSESFGGPDPYNKKDGTATKRGQRDNDDDDDEDDEEDDDDEDEDDDDDDDDDGRKYTENIFALDMVSLQDVELYLASRRSTIKFNNCPKLAKVQTTISCDFGSDCSSLAVLRCRRILMTSSSDCSLPRLPLLHHLQIRLHDVDDDDGGDDIIADGSSSRQIVPLRKLVETYGSALRELILENLVHDYHVTQIPLDLVELCPHLESLCLEPYQYDNSDDKMGISIFEMCMQDRSRFSSSSSSAKDTARGHDHILQLANSVLSSTSFKKIKLTKGNAFFPLPNVLPPPSVLCDLTEFHLTSTMMSSLVSHIVAHAPVLRVLHLQDRFAPKGDHTIDLRSTSLQTLHLALNCTTIKGCTLPHLQSITLHEWKSVDLPNLLSGTPTLCSLRQVNYPYIGEDDLAAINKTHTLTSLAATCNTPHFVIDSLNLLHLPSKNSQSPMCLNFNRLS
eukprot:TRINITY_DN13551_c0_g1_i8.p1 TRINITY_DN13551_c0_g1~~TRINITY_DN13551_c0_g1_i8.p1  ORF type:complete len:576 (+),score=86.05 TRINITY_DN13551_c0_g1_i8:845-2572(+)